MDNLDFAKQQPPYRLPDDEWFEMLRKSCDDPSLGLPLFPADDVQRQWIGGAGIASLGAVFKFYPHIKSKVDLATVGNVLDFGCGYGRMTRAFLNDVQPSQIFGVDTNPMILDLCRETNVPGEYKLIDRVGTLPFPDGHFGLVYAYSVFTHLPEHVQENWLAEIHRVLKPGGVLIATVEPPRVFDHFASLDIADKNIDPWRLENAKSIQSDPKLREAFKRDGFAFHGGEKYGGTYGDAFISPAYVNSRWTKWFKIAEYRDDPSFLFQAVVTAVKPK